MEGAGSVIARKTALKAGNLSSQERMVFISANWFLTDSLRRLGRVVFSHGAKVLPHVMLGHGPSCLKTRSRCRCFVLSWNRSIEEERSQRSNGRGVRSHHQRWPAMREKAARKCLMPSPRLSFFS